MTSRILAALLAVMAGVVLCLLLNRWSLSDKAATTIQALSSFVSGAGTIVIAYLTLNLMKTTRGQLDVITQQSEHMAGQLQATKDGLKLTKDSFQRTERPFIYAIGVTNVDLSQNEYTDELFPVIRYRLANYGRTPAKIIGHYERSYVDARPSKDDLMPGDDGRHLATPVLAAEEKTELIEFIFPQRIDWTEQFSGEPPPDGWEYPTHMIPTLVDGQRLFFEIRITYLGPYDDGEAYTLNECWRYSPGGDTGGQFVPYRGEDNIYT